MHSSSAPMLRHCLDDLIILFIIYYLLYIIY